jgi:hypothetical protein
MVEAFAQWRDSASRVDLSHEWKCAEKQNKKRGVHSHTPIKHYFFSGVKASGFPKYFQLQETCMDAL